ncbi:MAG: ADP-ribosylglycohydrolase family protein [Polyangiaceae bacterium]
MISGNLDSGRVIGALVGGAIGDALGALFEGREADGSRVLPSRGIFTDDTELTLATCEAIVAARGLDLDVVAAHFATWFRSGRIHGAGSSTTKALRDLAAGAHWALAGARGEHAAGSGAAMRVAPLAFLLDLDSDEDRTTLRDLSRITHHNDEAYSAAVAVVAAVQAACADLTGDALLDVVIRATPDSLVRDRLTTIPREPRRSVDAIVAVTERSGRAASVVPFAIAVAADATDLGSLLTAIVQAGGDTDTTGSIAGQILGARVGVGALPIALVEGVVDIALVRRVADEFAAFVEMHQA